MTEVVLVSCSKSKRNGTHQARDLYEPSPIFRKRRKYALSNGGHWGVLSARYGYLRPWDIVPNYEMHITARTSIWGAFVLQDLLPDLQEYGAGIVTILAGRWYVDPIIDELTARGYRVNVPFDGLRPGERMSALNDTLVPGRQTTLEENT